MIFGYVRADYVQPRLRMYGESMFGKSVGLQNCARLIDRTVLSIARPVKEELQAVVYSGHNQKRVLKFQATCELDGMFLHSVEPYEDQRHD